MDISKSPEEGGQAIYMVTTICFNMGWSNISKFDIALGCSSKKLSIIWLIC